MRSILITDYLDETIKKFPNNLAIVDEYTQITYLELRDRAKSIASFIIERNIFKQPIVIMMGKSVQCISAFLGVAYSGNFYTPIDIKMPISRIEKILETLNPAMIIIGKDCNSYSESEIFSKYPLIFYDNIFRKSFNESEITAITNRIIDTDVLYVLFTSGSTGVPKGVIINHRSVIDYIAWVVKTFDIKKEDRFGNQAPFYFDNSILDIYSTLKTGSTMYIIPEKLFSFPIQLLTYLNEKKITIIFWVPSALSIVANLKAVGKVEMTTLQKVLFCGEPMPNKQLNMWRKAYPNLLYANLYGPTEITDVCTYYIVNREFEDGESLPIGYPCENTDIIVLNEKNQLVQEDEIGELCVRGTSLSYGYYNNTQKTEEAFVQNPLNKHYNEIIYRTGDLVKYNDYGELLYVSRKDFQIKHMGHRIELGEIENAVNSLETVKSCCCIYDYSNSKIVLFYVADNEIKNLKKLLKYKLSDYMIPSKINILEQMPMNLNGKIDRNKLKELL